MAGVCYAGTSGFSYPEWRGTFYPADLPADAMLEHYSRVLSTVEVNNTFYRFPRAEHVQAWRAATPPGFRFSVKVHRRITHVQRLRDAAELVGLQLERVRPLGDRLGPLLFQLPPSLRRDVGLLRAFLAGLPPLAAAFEFRHASWYAADIYESLADHGAALVIMESDEDEPVIQEVGPFAYLRLHRSAYAPEALEAWAARIRTWNAAGRDVYAYFTHEDGAPAPTYARALREMVAGA